MSMKRPMRSLTGNIDHINIKCTVDEKIKIKELAAKAKISMSQYIILKCLEHLPVIRSQLFYINLNWFNKFFASEKHSHISIPSSQGFKLALYIGHSS